MLKILYGYPEAPLQLGSLRLTCYILDDWQRIFDVQDIISEMGYDGKSSDWLTEFLLQVKRYESIPEELFPKFEEKIFFSIDKNGNKKTIEGITPHRLLHACNVIVKANEKGLLYMSELKFAKAAEIILKNLNTTNATALIDYATGYELFKLNHKEALGIYMSSEAAAKWIKSFPDEFFHAVFNLLEGKWEDLNQNPTIIANFIEEGVFARLPLDLLDELRVNRPNMKYRKPNKLEQYIAHPALLSHLQTVTALIKAAGEKQVIFSQLMEKTLPRYRESIIWSDTGHEKKPELSFFNEALKNVLKPLPKKKRH